MVRNTHDFVNDHFTTETDTTKRAAPDGTGGIAWVTSGGGAGDTGALLLDNIISPPQITADTSDWNPTGLATAQIIRFDLDADHNLDGIVAPAGTWSFLLLSIASFTLTLVNYTSSSSAGVNTFVLPNNANLPVPPGGVVLFVYDEGFGQWFVESLGASGGGGSGAALDFQSFTTTDAHTWNVPSGTVVGAQVICIGAGGGGGGGSKGAASQLNLGGCGGGSGGWTEAWIDGADLSTNKNVYVGFGGSGGAGATSNDSNGSAGTTGDWSGFGQSSVYDASNALVVAGGGQGGDHGARNVVGNTQIGGRPGLGNIAGGVPPDANNSDGTTTWTAAQLHELVASGGRSVDATTSNNIKGADRFACGGGGGGGVTTTGNAARDGGRGGIPAALHGGDRIAATDSTSGWPFAAAGANPGGNGGTAPDLGKTIKPGFGGGGGAARISGASKAGNGSAGSSYGGGGGGGGAGRNSAVDGGDGADGAQGAVFVFTWYNP